MHVLLKALDDDCPLSGNLLRPGPKPKFTDIQVIALSITAECLSIDSELYLFHKIECDYKDAFPDIISRRQYNDRRKALCKLTDKLRNKCVKELNALADVFAIDSMPLEICKLSRMERNKMGKENESVAPDKGYCASQNKWYYGYKLHGICSTNGVLQSTDLTQASVHDVRYLKNVGDEYSNCVIIGDRGYINKELKKELRENCNVDLEVPYRNNQTEFKPTAYIFKKLRKRIETVFSQLCDHFMIQRNYAKSFLGYRTRILGKITGFTLLQYINKIRGNPIAQIKYALK